MLVALIYVSTGKKFDVIYKNKQKETASAHLNLISFEVNKNVFLMMLIKSKSLIS